MNHIIDNLQAQLQATEDPRRFIDLMNELSRQYLVRDAKVGRLFGEQAGTLAIEENYEQGMADSLCNQAFSMYYSGQYNQAILHGVDLITRYVRLEDYHGLIASHILIGLCEAAVNNYGEALEYFLKSLDVAKHLGEKEAISDCYNHIAQIYAATQKYDTALEYYQKAIDLRADTDDLLGLADVFNHLAELYNTLERYDDALNFANRASIIFEQAQYDVGLARTYNIMGTIYTNWSHYAQAQEYLIQSRDTASHNDWLAIELVALHQLARLHIKMSDMLGALDFLKQARTRASMLEKRDVLAGIHLDFSQVYKRMDDYEMALKHFEIYHNLYRDLFAEERDAKLRSLEIGHKTKTAQQEAMLQRERAETLEERRTEDRQYFERLNAMRDEFLHSTTHDLKNPLATINTNIYLLRKTIDQPRALEFVNRIETQTKRMHTLITDMLELAKLETRRALERQKASMAELIAGVLEEFQPVADQRQIALQFDNKAENSYCLIDPKLIERVFSNLVSNAIKYSEDGGMCQISLTKSAQEMLIIVSDTGVGIPPESLPHIFEAFYRVGEEYSRSVDGTGLGLAIVKTIIEQHGGTIAVDSETGTGTTFTITLPEA